MNPIVIDMCATTSVAILAVAVVRRLEEIRVGRRTEEPSGYHVRVTSLARLAVAVSCGGSFSWCDHGLGNSTFTKVIDSLCIIQSPH